MTREGDVTHWESIVYIPNIILSPDLAKLIVSRSLTNGVRSPKVKMTLICLIFTCVFILIRLFQIYERCGIEIYVHDGKTFFKSVITLSIHT